MSFFCLVRLLKNVIAVDADVALRGRQASGHDIHGGGVPGSVRPQKAINLAAVHLEAQVGYRQMLPIPLGQMFNFDQGCPLLCVRIGLL